MNPEIESQKIAKYRAHSLKHRMKYSEKEGRVCTRFLFSYTYIHRYKIHYSRLGSSCSGGSDDGDPAAERMQAGTRLLTAVI